MAKYLAPSVLPIILLQILAPLTVTAANSDIFGPATAATSRYWDCCKPSCGWADKAKLVGNKPVLSCDGQQDPLSDFGAGTGCNKGTAFSCADQSPWAVNDTFAYGFVGAFLLGGMENHWCCSCYELEFLDGDIKGQKMIVQASNTDYELTSENIFTFGIPGGNTSYAQACGIQYNVSNSVFGEDNVGLTTRAQCDDLPEPMKAGCKWRFDWFKDAIKPNVSYKRTKCPKELTDITQCLRTDEDTFEAAANGSSAASTSHPPSSSTLLLSSALVGIIASWMVLV